MVASRRRRKRGHSIGPFGLAVLLMGLMPRSLGYQDLVALEARQPEAVQRARAALASPFGTIHAATFSLPRPIGTLIPEPPRVQAALAPGKHDITGAIGHLYRPRLDFPVVNRRLKGDLLSRSRQEEPPPDGRSRDLIPGRVKTVSFPKPAEAAPADGFASPGVDLAPAEPKPDALGAQPLPVPPRTGPPDGHAAAGAGVPSSPNDLPQSSRLDPVDDTNPAIRLGRLYFGNNPVGEAVAPIQPWPMGEELLIQSPPANDPDIKRSTTIAAGHHGDATPNETVAAKGEVTGPGARPRTPAERLGLDSRVRAKAEKCLADAVYFEARGESKRGQVAVAQVVMNRVFSGFYPTDVCGVVYQNAHRKFACQFTFACDNVREVVNEPAMWRQAMEIARDMLDGKLWLPEVGHSTHYHAYWVHPAWVREMRRMQKIGVHSFYRPRSWGDGSDAPPLGWPQADEPEKKAKL
jgi:spore germination cell wall hydrolase CwlJ-like protein